MWESRFVRRVLMEVFRSRAPRTRMSRVVRMTRLGRSRGRDNGGGDGGEAAHRAVEEGSGDAAATRVVVSVGVRTLPQANFRDGGCVSVTGEVVQDRKRRR